MTHSLSRIAVLAALAAVWGSSGAAQTFEAKGRALDGDTLAIDLRLLGVDAFERRQLCERSSACWPCGKAAQDTAARALRAQSATIRLTGNSSYGRPVAIVTVDRSDLGERLILAGLAIPQLEFLKGDPTRAARYRAAFTRARSARAGAFAGQWIEPSRWRRGARLTCER